MISALPYRDRVVQHALCNVIEPIFDRALIFDSYACRKNRGSHKAIDRFQEFSRKNRYVLKCDVRPYFASINHQILSNLISNKIKDARALWLIRRIIDSTACPGIPIGNLASQIFANLYLNKLDHYIKEELKCRHYIRYMDDLIIFDNDRHRLDACKGAVREYLRGLALELHEKKSNIYPTRSGVVFLGYKVYPTHRLVIRQNIRRVRSRMKKYAKLLAEGLIASDKIIRSMQSWLGHAFRADSYNLRRRLLAEFNFEAYLPTVGG